MTAVLPVALEANGEGHRLGNRSRVPGWRRRRCAGRSGQGDLSFIAILVGVPFIVLIYPQFPSGHFTFRRRMLIMMLAGWVMIIVQQYFSQRYEAMQPWDGELRTDLGDGLIFYIGWLPMILGAIPSLVICAIDDYRQKRGLSGLIRPFEEHLAESGPRE